MAGLEALRTMKDEGYTTEYPVALVNWTNEEGGELATRMTRHRTDLRFAARFPLSVHGSSVWSGKMSLEAAYDLRDVADKSISAGAEVERIGYKGDIPASHQANPLAAHFELHIGESLVL